MRTVCFNVFTTGNLLNSPALYQSYTCAKERKHAFQNNSKVDGQVFNTVHPKRSRFHALLKYFRLKMIYIYDSKIGLARLEIPVQKPNAKDQCNGIPCTDWYIPLMLRQKSTICNINIAIS